VIVLARRPRPVGAWRQAGQVAEVVDQVRLVVVAGLGHDPGPIRRRVSGCGAHQPLEAPHPGEPLRHEPDVRRERPAEAARGPAEPVGRVADRRAAVQRDRRRDDGVVAVERPSGAGQQRRRQLIEPTLDSRRGQQAFPQQLPVASPQVGQVDDAVAQVGGVGRDERGRAAHPERDPHGAGRWVDEYRPRARAAGRLVWLRRTSCPNQCFTTKAEVGHDEFMTMDDVRDAVGEATANELGRLTLVIYSRGAEIARERGVIIADTKFEFGRDSAGSLILADEVLTPDSSRFWKVSEYEPGRPQWSYDKQYLREWSSSLGDSDRTYPGPPVPPDVVDETRTRYVEIFEQLTGEKWSS
jgi:hypothetical protein